jgi:CHAT domain-containing protein
MSRFTYADLEIRILNKTADGYPVELTLNSEQQYSGGRLDPGGLPWLPTADPVADGQRLFAWLFADAALNTAWAQIRGRHSQRRVRLRIDADAPELHAIPWELLREPMAEGTPYDLAAANATPFSRYLAGQWQPGSPILQRPLRVLVAIAGPDDLAARGLHAINVAEEWAALQQALAGVEVELIQLPQPCTLAAIEAALKQRIHILHFIGHGHYNAQQQSAALLLANDKNAVQPVTDADIAAMLARQLADSAVQNDDKLRLVFLSSCETAVRSPADAFRGLAPRLVAAGVPAVVAMQDLVPIATARAFAATFYRQLLQHGQVDLAANEARAHLLTAKLPGASIPVLFMRLRDGALLGQRGRIGGDKSESFWPFLLEDLRKGTCVPFLGPGVATGLLPAPGDVATKLAEKYNYPLTDTHDLAKVARYIALNAPQDLRTEYTRILRRSLFAYLGLKPTKEDRQRYVEANFTETATGIGWAEKVLTLHENEIHHLLADLRLPLYMTTNCDSFMTEALRARGLISVRRAGPRWEQVQAGTPQYTLDPEPSRANPVVFHLNGYDEDPRQASQLVLSEDDFLAHFVRLRRDHNAVLPMDVIELLGQSSFLFLGYSLDDWEFRVVLQGLVAGLDRPKKVNVGVQLEQGAGQNAEKVINYLGDYMRQYNINIYWGTPQQFVTELQHEWQKLGGTTGIAEEKEWKDDKR